MAVVISAIGHETWFDTRVLTWAGFARPFLLLFRENLRNLLRNLDGVLFTERPRLTSGRHAIELCWMAVDIAYGSKISFEEYLEKLWEPEIITIWKNTYESFSLSVLVGDVASLYHPYRSSSPDVEQEEAPIEQVLVTRMNDYAAISKFSRACGMRFDATSNVPVQMPTSPTFRHQEISLPSILKGTDLAIIWCDNVTEHLYIGQVGATRYLSLYWPCHTGLTASQLTR